MISNTTILLYALIFFVGLLKTDYECNCSDGLIEFGGHCCPFGTDEPPTEEHSIILIYLKYFTECTFCNASFTLRLAVLTPDSPQES